MAGLVDQFAAGAEFHQPRHHKRDTLQALRPLSHWRLLTFGLALICKIRACRWSVFSLLNSLDGPFHDGGEGSVGSVMPAPGRLTHGRGCAGSRRGLKPVPSPLISSAALRRSNDDQAQHVAAIDMQGRRRIDAASISLRHKPRTGV